MVCAACGREESREAVASCSFCGAPLGDPGPPESVRTASATTRRSALRIDDGIPSDAIDVDVDAIADSGYRDFGEAAAEDSAGTAAATVARSYSTRDPHATEYYAAQAYQQPPPAPVGDVWSHVQPGAWPARAGDGGAVVQRTAPPPEIWIVAIGMFALAALLAYPALRFGIPLLPQLFASDAFSRALSALFEFGLFLVGACSAALVALAVGMLRGSRVAQGLTAIFAGALAVGIAVIGVSTAGGDTTYGAVVVIIVLICVAVVVLVTVPPTARRFFAQDTAPFGITVAATACVYFGWCIAVGGLLLMLGGELGARYVGWGLVSTVVGVLLVLLVRPLRQGNPAARVAVSVALVAYVVIDLVFAAQGGSVRSPGTVVVAVLGAGAAVLLWAAPSSVEHFATAPHPVRAHGPATVTALGLLAVLAVVFAAVGFAAASKASSSSDSLTGGVGVSNGPPSDPAVSAGGQTVDAGPLTHTWTTTESGSGGEQESVEIDAGEPQHLVDGLTEGNLIAGSACSIDASDDAVIPAKLVMQNTGNTAAYAAVQFDFAATWDDAAVEAQFSDGPQCEADDLDTYSTNALGPGASSVLSMFFVVHGYYDQAYPSGDSSVLAGAVLNLDSVTYTPDDGSTSVSYAPQSVSGPGADGDSVPLAGSDQSPGSGLPSDALPSDALPSDTDPVSSPAALPDGLVSRQGPVDDGGCAEDATGEVATFLDAHGCTDLKRSLYTATVAGRPVVVSVADVFLDDPADVPSFVQLITSNGTGDVTNLIDADQGFTGGPSAFASDPTFLAAPEGGSGEVVVLEAMWGDGTTTHADDPQLTPLLTDAAPSTA